MTKRLWGLLLMGLLHIPMGCLVDDGGCGSFDSRARVVSIESAVGTFNEQGFVLRSGLISRPWQEAAIQILADSVEYLSKSPGSGFSIMSQAYACSPPPPTFPFIEGIYVIADSSFLIDETMINPGDTVNQLFQIINGEANTFDRFIARHNEGSWLFGYDSDMVLSLRTDPGDSIASTFQVFMHFDEGEILSTQTPVLKVH